MAERDVTHLATFVFGMLCINSYDVSVVAIGGIICVATIFAYVIDRRR